MARKQPLTNLFLDLVSKDKAAKQPAQNNELAVRHRLLTLSIGILGKGYRDDELFRYLGTLGLDEKLRLEVYEEAVAAFEQQIAMETPLPPTAHGPYSYYSVLGIPPTASGEAVHQAYRSKAKEIHPDQRNALVNPGDYARLMTIISEADAALNAPVTRRAYDFMLKSRNPAALDKRALTEGPRPDFEAYCRWEMAELSQLEEQIGEMLKELREQAESPASLGMVRSALRQAFGDYEDLVARMQTLIFSFPPAKASFGEALTVELSRKEGVTGRFKGLDKIMRNRNASFPSEEVKELGGLLSQVRRFHSAFDLRAAVE